MKATQPLSLPSFWVFVAAICGMLFWMLVFPMAIWSDSESFFHHALGLIFGNPKTVSTFRTSGYPLLLLLTGFPYSLGGILVLQAVLSIELVLLIFWFCRDHRGIANIISILWAISLVPFVFMKHISSDDTYNILIIMSVFFLHLYFTNRNMRWGMAAFAMVAIVDAIRPSGLIVLGALSSGVSLDLWFIWKQQRSRLVLNDSFRNVGIFALTFITVKLLKTLLFFLIAPGLPIQSSVGEQLFYNVYTGRGNDNYISYNRHNGPASELYASILEQHIDSLGSGIHYEPSVDTLTNGDPEKLKQLLFETRGPYFQQIFYANKGLLSQHFHSEKEVDALMWHAALEGLHAKPFYVAGLYRDLVVTYFTQGLQAFPNSELFYYELFNEWPDRIKIEPVISPLHLSPAELVAMRAHVLSILDVGAYWLNLFFFIGLTGFLWSKYKQTLFVIYSLALSHGLIAAVFADASVRYYLIFLLLSACSSAIMLGELAHHISLWVQRLIYKPLDSV